MMLIAGLGPGIGAVKNESWEHFRYLSLFFHLSLGNASAVIVIHARLSDGTRLKGPVSFSFSPLPVNSYKCYNYECAVLLTSARNRAAPSLVCAA